MPTATENMKYFIFHEDNDLTADFWKLAADSLTTNSTDNRPLARELHNRMITETAKVESPLALLTYWLMEDISFTQIAESMRDHLEREEELATCGRCGQQKPDVEEQYSWGYYAGRFCRQCAYDGFTDHCGHSPRHFDVQELFECEYGGFTAIHGE